MVGFDEGDGIVGDGVNAWVGVTTTARVRVFVGTMINVEGVCLMQGYVSSSFRGRLVLCGKF